MFSLKLDTLFEFGRKWNRNATDMLTNETAFISSEKKTNFIFFHNGFIYV